MQVRYVDASPYGSDVSDVTLMDLDGSDPLISLSALTPLLRESGKRVVVFADHCLEHLSKDTIDHLFTLINDEGAICLFRVPNILSTAGQRNYLRDATHRTSFDSDYRNELVKRGFLVRPYRRWYRFGLPLLMTPDRTAMEVADEIVIARPASNPVRHALGG
jgi:hypothetical protein